MSLNRNLAYTIRKHMPDIPLLHNAIASKILKDFKKQLISKDYVERAEKDPSTIQGIVSELEESRRAQIAGLVSSFDKYLEKAGIKYSEEAYQYHKTQMLFNCLAYGFAPDEYVYYKLAERSLDEKKAYITDLDRKMMQYIMSDFKDLQYVFDKAATYEKFGKYYRREEISVANSNDYEKFKDFARKHDYLVVKEVSNSCGQGITIEKSERDDLKTQFDRILSRGKCSIEERISQAGIMSQFNESSVNTLRVIMFNTKSGIKIGPCFFRTGRAGAVVDNAGSGGVFMGVDRYTGILDSDGCDEYLNRYECHPNSGIKYVGFQLPAWDECIALVKEMGALVPRLGYIGWDLAYTDSGWVLVEANGGSQFVSQICYDKGCKPEIEEYIKDRNVY